MAKENNLLNKILLNLAPNRVLFRNNVALAWVGKSERVETPKPVMMYPGDVLVREARVLHAGLCKGSSDLIGWESIEVTEEMVGSKVAVFLAVEAKTGRVVLTEDQKNFLAQVSAAGGIGELIRE